MLSVILLRVIMLSVIMLSVIMLSVIMLSVIMLSVIMLSVINAYCHVARQTPLLLTAISCSVLFSFFIKRPSFLHLKCTSLDYHIKMPYLLMP
jgi:hypothetical protein